MHNLQNSTVLIPDQEKLLEKVDGGQTYDPYKC